MDVVLILLVTIGLAATLVSALAPPRLGQATSVAAGLTCFGLTIALVPAVADQPVGTGFLRADALSTVFALAVGFIYAASAVYCVGYLRPAAGHEYSTRYLRRFYAGLNLFAWAMLCAPLLDGLALLWIAIEVTTVVSALLVAIDNTDGATEAAWKYVLIASSGLAIALLATIVMYYAGAQVLGEGFDLALAPLIRVGGQLPESAVRLAFVLAVLGFGTKVGLVPAHTWLPDAHSEAPTPISAMLSGALLADSFYAVLRYYQISIRALGPSFPQTVLLAFGIASLALAALYLLDQGDIKRMLAYSSIEHMGILAVGVGFGVPMAYLGVLLHVLAHAAAKGSAFFGAGVIVRKFRTKDMAVIRGGADVLPWTAPLFVLSVLILSALPPFGIFRSEFLIVAGGLATPSRAALAGVLVVLVTMAFFGLALATTRMIFAPAPAPAPASAPAPAPGVPPRPRPELALALAGGPLPPTSNRPPSEPASHGSATGPPQHPHRGEPSGWLVVPMLAGIALLLLLGLHLPAELSTLLRHGAAELAGSRT